MDAPNSPGSRPAGPAPGPLAVVVEPLWYPHALDPGLAHRIAGWSWHAQGEAPLFAEDLVRGPLDGRRVFCLAFAGNRLAGFLHAFVDLQPRRLAFETLVVDPAERRRGVASRLVRFPVAQLGSCQVATLVAESNVAGQCFWRSLGFVGRKCRRAPKIRFARAW